MGSEGFCDARLPLTVSSNNSGCAASADTSYLIKQDTILWSKD